MTCGRGCVCYALDGGLLSSATTLFMDSLGFQSHASSESLTV